MGISEIKKILTSADIEELRSLIPEYEKDERAGVKKLVESAKKRIADFEKEVERTYKMKEYERKYEKCRYICGIDEVGRGPLAGPVVAAAVILAMICSIGWDYIPAFHAISGGTKIIILTVVISLAFAILFPRNEEEEESKEAES